ncbi:unnamed protein product [Vitrella brassicaformis CCMP3155]|uniref:Alpha-glucosidase n=2 Tax=Vitrella brassicaformis TaxID=1169539 RepID=A0A0G4GLN7_VITBC|nr:unnamed protein product [Vitrella brassicaformis CCMP3155]|eukprot:CEM30994.1 unnamed protein product [Vitrella brassicaformis CCMP3155]
MGLHALLILLSLICLAYHIQQCIAADVFRTVLSPPASAPYQVSVFINESNSLKYSVETSGGATSVLVESSLSLTVDGWTLGEGVEIVGSPVEGPEVHETYRTRGKHSVGADHHRETVFTLRHNASAIEFNVVFRLFYDGFAFRYWVPASGGFPTRNVTADGSHFNFAFTADDYAWFTERDVEPVWELYDYGGIWKTAPASTLPTRTPRYYNNTYGAIILIEDTTYTRPFPFIFLTESALYDFSGLRLKALADPQGFQADLADTSFAVNTTKDGGFRTPWRTVVLAKSLDQLVNTDMISSLNPSPEQRNPGLFVFDTSTTPPSYPAYIQPGRSVWRDYLFGKGNTTEEGDYIDLASQLGFEYTTIRGWDQWADPYTELTTLVAFADSRGVKVIVQKRTDEVDDTSSDYLLLRQWLDQVASTGVAGVRFSGLKSASYASVLLSERMMYECALRSLVVTQQNLPFATGAERTYPNEITREAVRSLEFNKRSGFPDLLPPHYLALPYTRMVLGSTQFTPFIQNTLYKGNTTTVFQLASAICFDAYMWIIPEDPFVLLNSFSHLSLLQSIPTTWEETVVLPASKVGYLTIMTRRTKDNTWFLAAIVGVTSQADQEAALSEIPLDFLSESIPYNATFVYTQSNVAGAEMTGEVFVESFIGRRLSNVQLQSGGSEADGLVAVFVPTVDNNSIL